MQERSLTFREHIAATIPTFDDDPSADTVEIPRADPSSPPSKSSAASRNSSTQTRTDERVTINIRMVADPARREQGDSERAIARYEMKRIVRVNRVSVDVLISGCR